MIHVNADVRRCVSMERRHRCRIRAERPQAEPWRGGPWAVEARCKGLNTMSTYRVEPLGAARVDQAFTLIRLVAPTLELKAWRAFCRNMGGATASSRALSVVINPRGYVQGLCLTELKDHPLHGRIVDVPVFLATSAADEEGVAGALLGHLGHLSRLNGDCPARIWTERDDVWSRPRGECDVGRWDHGVMVMFPATGRGAEPGTTSL